MTDDVRVREIVESLLETGATPEEACRDTPDLLPDVRRRWMQVRSLEAEVDALFPRRPRPVPAALPQIAGHEVIELLGRGGMGVVYRARNLRLGRIVAVKTILAESSATQGERFQREVEAVAALDHPHVVQIHEVGDQDGRPFFTMELLDGGSLAQKLAARPMEARAAAKLLAQLADAVQAAHDAGIVHRDLKPANVLFAHDGTPKIADFGLARRFRTESDLTKSNVAVGTPSYMAPEQARGEGDASCPRVDVYALGAILYETLTGRPPFKGATMEETLQQVFSEDPPSLEAEDHGVPRDLETICLKCLSKAPEKRYPSARDLADDLLRFLRDEPILARPTGTLERTRKWVRRHPARSTLAAAGALAMLALGGVDLWWSAQNARAAKAAETGLATVVDLERSGDWSSARVALERARASLGMAGSAAVSARIDERAGELDLVARLERVRLDRVTIVGGQFNIEANEDRASGAYEAAFRSAGWGDVVGTDTAVATRIRSSLIRGPLVVALDDWASCAAREGSLRDRLLEVARLADPDPSGWRDRVRDPATWSSLDAMSEQMRTAPPSGASVPLLLGLARRAKVLQGDSVPFLKRVQQDHPGDYCVNFMLGLYVGASDPAQAVRYFQAAVAIRPDTAIAHHNLGTAFGEKGQLEEARLELEQAIRLDPTLAIAHFNLGNVLRRTGRIEDSIASYREALRLDPQIGHGHADLGIALLDAGRPDEALEELRIGAGRWPSDDRIHAALAFALQATGKLDEAVPEYEQALRLNAERADTHSNYARALAARGRLDEALEHARRGVALAPDRADTHAALAVALSARGDDEAAMRERFEAVRLDPDTATYHDDLGAALARSGRTAEALAEMQRGLALDPADASALVNLGKALANAGRLDDALARFDAALRIAPDSPDALGSTGVVLIALGRFAEAEQSLARCLERLPADHAEHAERVRQLAAARELIALERRLPGVLAGKDAAVSASEGVRFAEMCRIRKRYRDCVRLSEQAFAADPGLVGDPTNEFRRNAACAAALASTGVDGASPGSEEAARYRKQARDWLRADLALWERTLDDRGAEARGPLAEALGHWRVDPDLAAIRDAEALAAFEDAERADCKALWKDVDLQLARAEIMK